jgi:hypothetical protein
MTSLILIAAAFAAYSSSELAPFGSSRMASDLSGFDWLEVRDEPGRSWVVAEVTPAPSSGQLRVPGAYVQDGKLVVPEGSEWAAFIEGTMEVREVLTGSAPRGRLDYRWRSPTYARLPEDRALHSPFRDAPALVLCQIVEGAQDASRFPRVVMIPERWLAALPGARAALADQRSDFEGTPSPAALRRLEALAKGENPWLVVAAARALWRAGQPVTGASALDDELRGALAVLELEYAPSPDRLVAEIRNARSQRDIVPIALAALEAVTGQVPEVYRRGQVLVAEIRARRSGLAGEPAPLLDAILKHAPAGDSPSPQNHGHR